MESFGGGWFKGVKVKVWNRLRGHYEASKRNTITFTNQQLFKQLHLKINENKAQLESLKSELGVIMNRQETLRNEILRVKKKLWILEGTLQIASQTSRLADLRNKEIEIMAELDSLFVDRIRITAGASAFHCKSM